MKCLYLSQKGTGAYNEDVIIEVNANKKYFWIFDGATPIFKNIMVADYGSSAEWLVKELSNKMMKIIKKFPDIDFLILLKKAINTLLKDEGTLISRFNVNDFPSFTMVAAVTSKYFTTFYVIGDCVAHILNTNRQMITLTDQRYEKYDHELTIFRNSHNMQNTEDKDKYVNKRLEIKSYMNKENGFWLGTINKDWINKNQIKVIKMANNTISKFFLCSDGFSRLLKIFPEISPFDVLSEKLSLKTYLSKIRNAEKTNHSLLNNWSKESDDASAMLVEDINVSGYISINLDTN